MTTLSLMIKWSCERGWPLVRGTVAFYYLCILYSGLIKWMAIYEGVPLVCIAEQKRGEGGERYSSMTYHLSFHTGLLCILF